METWYKVEYYYDQIKRVEVKSSSDKFVSVYNKFWKKDQRIAKASRSHGYFTTFEDAKAVLVLRAKQALESYERSVIEAKKRFEKVSAIQTAEIGDE